MNEGYDLKQLFVDIKNHLKLEVDYGKLTAVEKLTILLSRMAIVGLFAMIGGMAFFYLTSTIAEVVTKLSGNAWLADLVVMGILVLVMVLVYGFRKQWIIDPIARFISKLFLNSNDDER